MPLLRSFSPLLALAFAATACIHIHVAEAGEVVSGSGHKVSVERKVQGFSRIELLTAADLEVTEGGPFSVTVTLDDNLQAHFLTRVDGETLVIDTHDRLRYRGEAKVKVSLPELRALSVEGSGDVVITGAQKDRDVDLSIAGSGDIRWSGKARSLEASIAGSGDMKLAGTADKLTAKVSGSGDIKARPLTVQSAKTSVSGSGDIELTMTGGALTTSISGSGDVTWWGQAQVESVSISGSGSLERGKN